MAEKMAYFTAAGKQCAYVREREKTGTRDHEGERHKREDPAKEA